MRRGKAERSGHGSPDSTAPASVRDGAGTVREHLRLRQVPPLLDGDYDQVLIALAPTALSLEIGGKTTTTWKRGDVAFIGRGEKHQAQNVSVPNRVSSAS